MAARPPTPSKAAGDPRGDIIEAAVESYLVRAMMMMKGAARGACMLGFIAPSGSD